MTPEKAKEGFMSSDDTVRAEAREFFFDLAEDTNKTNQAGILEYLVQYLDHEDESARSVAAQCIAATVRNNSIGQQRLLDLDVLPTLVKIATEDSSTEARARAIGALSGVSRNFQPALDVIVDLVPLQYKPENNLDASDMVSVNTFLNPLRAAAGIGLYL
jgi:hsp70-interacting protein